MAIAYPTVPVGPLVQDNEGLCDWPSHVNATGIAPPAVMSGLLRANDVFAMEPAVVATAAAVARVVPAIDVVDSIAAVVELGATDVVATESLFVCAEHPVVTRIIQVNEVMIRFFMELTVSTSHCNGLFYMVKKK